MKSLLKVCIATGLVACASPAFAQALRTWVSGVGDDANPCTRTAPCKTFAGAISKTADSGEIDALDPGGFGAVTITKSIVIDGGGGFASILAGGATGVNISGSGITVTLRNLAINGGGAATGNGVQVYNAAAVNLDHVVVENFAGVPTSGYGAGLAIKTSTPDTRVTVTNSDFYNDDGIGILSSPSAGNVILDVDNVRVGGGHSSGIELQTSTRATINRATLTNSLVGSGVTTGASGVTAHISNSVLSDNAYGVHNGKTGAATVTLDRDVITGNTSSGLRIDAGTVYSYGNNDIQGNAGNETPTTVISPR